MKNYKLLGRMAENGFSQRSLANSLKVSKNTVNSWINNRSLIPTDRIVEICQLMHITDPADVVDIFLPGLTRKSETM